MGCYVLDFKEIDQTKVAVVGGKGAHLAELSRIESIRVPVAWSAIQPTENAPVRICSDPSIGERI